MTDLDLTNLKVSDRVTDMTDPNELPPVPPGNHVLIEDRDGDTLTIASGHRTVLIEQQGEACWGVYVTDAQARALWAALGPTPDAEEGVMLTGEFTTRDGEHTTSYGPVCPTCSVPKDVEKPPECSDAFHIDTPEQVARRELVERVTYKSDDPDIIVGVLGKDCPDGWEWCGGLGSVWRVAGSALQAFPIDSLGMIRPARKPSVTVEIPADLADYLSTFEDTVHGCLNRLAGLVREAQETQA